MTGDIDYDLPCDLEAERSVIASMMLAKHAVTAAAELLDPDHFIRYSHEVLFRALINMYAADVRIDPVTVRAWINADGDMKALGGQTEGPLFIHELYALPVIPVNVTRYAKLVLAAALRRKGIEHARRAIQVFTRPEEDPDEVLGAYDKQLEAIRMIARPHARPVAGFNQVTEQASKERHPVIPGLLGEADRVIVVAGEGRGKTVLAHQMGFAAAAGVHPFAHTPIPPKRVLFADFENPELELADRFDAMGAVASRYPGWSEGNVAFHLRMEGVNLYSKQSDAFELMDAIRRFEPDLIVAGPIYKMIWPLKPADDSLRANAAVAAFWDQVRARYGSAVWLEVHAPVGAGGREREMRPEAWGGWMRWPEFGFAMRKGTKAHGGESGLEWGRFRGDRIAGRSWPSFLTRNPVPGGWPWVAGYDRGVLDTPMPDDDGWEGR